MTIAHRMELVLLEDGKLSLDHLPFRAGQTVEVIVLPASAPALPDPKAGSLHGSVVRFDRPTEPVSEADWGVLE